MDMSIRTWTSTNYSSDYTASANAAYTAVATYDNPLRSSQG